ncbi:MAG: inositol monophosphatase family protein [Planctomycetota bacterium]
MTRSDAMANEAEIVAALKTHMPAVLRWAGGVAKELRKHSISIGGKESGSSNTDALTLADLTVQQLVVDALRDCDPVFRQCRIEAEEETGDLHRFAKEGPLTLSLDPIDGTKQFRDRSGDGWSVMLHLRDEAGPCYSLVYIPSAGPHGRWVEVSGRTPADGVVRAGDDDSSLPARAALDAITPVDPSTRPASKKFYMIGFIDRQAERCAAVTAAGLEGVDADLTPGSIYDLFATGAFGGSLIHSPNVYDFPVSQQIAGIFGGRAVWCHSGETVHYREFWMDERASMLRLPGVVACAVDAEDLETLRNTAADWPLERYAD